MRSFHTSTRGKNPLSSKLRFDETLEPYSSSDLAAHLRANPHNLPGIPNFPPLSPHWITAARLELEGKLASPGADNPYNVGTMAAIRFERGQRWREGEEAWGDGKRIPSDTIAAQGWQYLATEFNAMKERAGQC